MTPVYIINALLKLPLSFQTLLTFSALLGFVWAYFLMTHKKGNRSANRFLALLILSFAVLLIRQIVLVSDQPGISLFIYFVSQSFFFVIGPSIYFHMKKLVASDLSDQKIGPHFIAAFAIGILMIIVFIFRENLKQVSNITILQCIAVIFFALQLSHLIGYIYYSQKLISAYEVGVKSYNSAVSKINLSWIKQLFWTSVCFAVVILSMYLLIISGGYYEVNNSADFLYVTLIAILILNLVLKSWREPEVISGHYKEPVKYKDSNLSDFQKDSIRRQLEKLMTIDKVYLTPELNLKQVADMMDVKPHLLSQVINEEFNVNFFNFINGFRIDHVLALIKEGQIKNKTLIGIAFDSGFNSKSSFQRAFKRKMKCTPRAYQKGLLANEVENDN